MSSPQVPFDDRGLAYGDGLFETVLLRNGEPQLWPYHRARLLKGCRQLSLPVPSDASLNATWAGGATSELEVLKLLLTRGSGGRGYVAPAHPAPRLLSRRTPFSPDQQRWKTGVTLRLCSLRLGHQPLLAGIKHLNRLENVLARQEWHDPDIAEGLLADSAGQLVEATSMNVVWQQDGQLCTPPVDRCGVAGTLRAALLAAGLLREVALPIDKVARVDRLWVANSVQGVWPVRQLVDEAGRELASWTLADHDPLQQPAHRLLGYSAA